jgi:hypothetical protein
MRESTTILLYQGMMSNAMILEIFHDYSDQKQGANYFQPYMKLHEI